jgi:protein O-GlcNAc transferase
MTASGRVARQKASRAARTGEFGAVNGSDNNRPTLVEANCRAALARYPGDINSRRRLSDIAHSAGRYDEAAELLAGFATTASEYTSLGVALQKLRRRKEAETAYRTAIKLDPNFAPAHFNLGSLLQDLQRDADAEAEYRIALALRSDYAKAQNGLGHMLQRQGCLGQALDAYRNAVQQDPQDPTYHCNLGTLLFALERNPEALVEFQHALKLQPDCSLAHGNLGALLLRSGHPIASEAESRAAIALDPGQPHWLTNLAGALLSQARYGDAEEAYRKALAMKPDNPTAHGNLLFDMNYRPDITAEAISTEYQEWDRRHAKQLAPQPEHFELDRTPGRRLRVGYVSPDFRQHAVALFAEPLIAAHDRSRVELYLYAGVAVEDTATKRFRSLADQWRDTLGLDDAKLADAIRADHIDVLVDLAGHSAGNRLLTFARRPAPVQVAYLLGHGYSSGLSAMDAFLADEILAPRPTRCSVNESSACRASHLHTNHPPVCRPLHLCPRCPTDTSPSATSAEASA